MEWAKFIAKNWCDWVKASIGENAFGDGSFVYDTKQSYRVPVFEKRVIVFGEQRGEISMVVDKYPEMNWKVFMCVRDMHHLAAPLDKRPEEKFGIPVESTKTLLSLTYHNCNPDAEALIPFLRVKIRPAIYADAGNMGQHFNELNDIALKTITGVLYHLRKNAQVAA